MARLGDKRAGERVTRCRPSGAAPKFAMSVDVEDYFQVWAFSDVIHRRSWDGFDCRFERATARILDLFDEKGVSATFFTLGWVAERAPGLIREIVARGHELASHGYDHAKVFDQGEEEFRVDAGRAKKILEDVAGVRVAGYRAPGFSIDARAPFAHRVLSELGYAYSSSAHPIAHDHYGDPDGPRAPYRPLEGSPFVEAPVATAALFGRRVSAAGGGWFRAAPYAVGKALVERAAASLDGPVIFYFHPWEIDPGQPRIRSASPRARLRHYLNLSRMEGKVARLLGDFPWGRIDHALFGHAARAAA